MFLHFAGAPKSLPGHFLAPNPCDERPDMTTHVHQFMCLQDNFGVLIHDSRSGATAAIDAPDAEAVIAAAQSREIGRASCRERV